MPGARNGKRSPARPEPAPSGDEPEKRRAILHAAVKVFAEKGYHGCRIADVARQAGVAYGLVYHYFRNKDELLESVFAEQWTIFINAIRAIGDGPGTASEHLASICRFAVDVYKTSPSAVRVLLLEVARTPNVLRAGSTPQTFQTAVALVAGIVRRGQREGDLRGDADPTVAAACVLGALELTLTAAVVGLVGDGREDEAERVKQAVVDFALAGLGVRPRS
ncbi:MAG TPA: TetR/AcrR family transcriptional regulator [Anaeromyxobacteraceae bacterium]|nr:TetR/AcrR family transcriptional regulator [Anaeromyxobacteraceae bacterium]